MNWSGSRSVCKRRSGVVGIESESVGSESIESKNGRNSGIEGKNR